MKYPIRLYGDPILKQKATPVKKVDATIRQLADDMLETMYEARGIGLAAQQIGETLAICVIDISPNADLGEEGFPQNPHVPMPLVLINPEITRASQETDLKEEGCLSFPAITAPIMRPQEVDVRFINREGHIGSLHARGLLARALQHEIDHLNGILFTERMSKVKRIALSGRLKRMQKKTEKVGSGMRS